MTSTPSNAVALLQQNSELRHVHDSLPENQWAFTKFLDDLLDNHNSLFGPGASKNFDESDLQRFSTTAQALAKQYIDQPRWHTPWLTRYLLEEVLEAQCTYLVWMAQRGILPEWHPRRWLSPPYRTFVPPLVSLGFLAFWLWFLYWLVTKEYWIAAGLPLFVVLYFYLFEKPYVWWRRRKNRNHFLRLSQLLIDPISEIRSSDYDPGIISRRLQACEQKDLQVASVAFALLNLTAIDAHSSAGSV
jgi:hypothetical protein